MEKRKEELVWMPGCQGCGRVECKHNLVPTATSWAASHFDVSSPYGCNSKLQNLNVEEVE